MMMNNIKIAIIIPLTFFGLIFGISSCGKKAPAKAEITVVDSANNRIEGATVNIVCTPIEKTTCTDGVEQENITNSSGKTEFTWDHPAIYGSKDVGFAVLKVEARANYDSIFCTTIVDSLGQDTTICIDSTFIRYGSTFTELKIDKITQETITVLF